MADHHHHNHFHTTNWWDSSRNINNNNPSKNSPPSSSGFGNWSSTAGDSSTTAGGSVDGGGDHMVDPNLHMMGLGLFNQTLIRGGGEEKGEGSFRSMLQENLNSIPSYHHHQQHQQQEVVSNNIGTSHQVQWRDKIFSLDQTQLSSPSSENSSVSYHVDNSPLYGGGGNSSTNSLLQGFLGSADHQNQFNNNNYGAAMNINNDFLGSNSWSKPNSTTLPQFLRASPPKQPPQPHSQLHFSNNAPFWNASSPSAAAVMSDVIRPTFFPSLQQNQFPTPNFDEKPKNIIEAKKNNEAPSTASKRPRNETSSPLPAFKVRKEKMGDRITALQQLVSPFGKTDTASVLSEAIEYIKFLHEQVNVLSTPYMKSGASSIQQQQQQILNLVTKSISNEWWILQKWIHMGATSALPHPCHHHHLCHNNPIDGCIDGELHPTSHRWIFAFVRRAALQVPCRTILAKKFKRHFKCRSIFADVEVDFESRIGNALTSTPGDKSEGGRQDLRSRGLCLVPVSSTFPVTHESPVDFWTPTFGGTFR